MARCSSFLQIIILVGVSKAYIFIKCSSVADTLVNEAIKSECKQTYAVWIIYSLLLLLKSIIQSAGKSLIGLSSQSFSSRNLWATSIGVVSKLMYFHPFLIAWPVKVINESLNDLLNKSSHTAKRAENRLQGL